MTRGRHRAHFRTPFCHRASRLVPQSDLPTRGTVRAVVVFLLVLGASMVRFGITVAPEDPPQVVQAAVVADVVCPVVLR